MVRVKQWRSDRYDGAGCASRSRQRDNCEHEEYGRGEWACVDALHEPAWLQKGGVIMLCSTLLHLYASGRWYHVSIVAERVRRAWPDHAIEWVCSWLRRWRWRWKWYMYRASRAHSSHIPGTQLAWPPNPFRAARSYAYNIHLTVSFKIAFELSVELGCQAWLRSSTWGCTYS